MASTTLSDALDAVIGSLKSQNAAYHHQVEAYCQRLRSQICAAISPLITCAAELDVDDSDTVIYLRNGIRRIRLFELGEFRRFEFHGASGYSSLYIGEDGHFYVYDDQRLGQRRVFTSYGAPGDQVCFKLRPFPLEDMEEYDLERCRELVWRAWI